MVLGGRTNGLGRLTAGVLIGLWCLCGTAVGEGGRLDGLKQLEPKTAKKDAKKNWLWYDVRELDVEGRGWKDTARFFNRLPARAKDVVRKPVWSLSINTAGFCVRFATDADQIAVRWALTSKNLAMPHMPATGVSGVDLYVRHEGRWRWTGASPPKGGQSSEVTLAKGIPAGMHEYMLYLPLYNGVTSASIGLPAKAKLCQAPARPGNRAKPIVYYGTSIAQGGCAARPGMVHTAILGRRLDWHVINLGFSGNGKLDPELGDLMAELDAAVYVLDCLPNLDAKGVTERTEPFVAKLRKARPDTPILLVENIAYQAGAFLPERREAYRSKNRALKAAYDRLVANGVKGLHYAPGETLLGTDGDATVDGTHCTDLGFQRYADGLEPVLRRILKP